MNSAQPSIVQFYPAGEEPVFAAPWEAHAFALTVQLHAQGLFSWTEWSDTLAASIRKNNAAPYYESWLNALESLVLKKGALQAQELLDGIQALMD